MLVTKKKGREADNPAESSPGRALPSTYKLPEEPEEAVSDVGQLTFLIWGERKIGKTSLSSKFPKTFHFLFEPGGKGFTGYKVRIKKWEDFQGYVRALIEEGVGRFQTVSIDIADKAWDMCSAYVCKNNGWETPGDAPWGSGWDAVPKEFGKQIDLLTNAGFGILFLSHATEREFLYRAGGSYHKLIPTMSKQASKYIMGFVDVIGFFGYYGTDRYLTIHGSDSLEGGQRCQERFRTVNGEIVHSIPMGLSPEEGYENLVTAFNNKQVEVFNLDDTDIEIRDQAKVKKPEPKSRR